MSRDPLTESQLKGFRTSMNLFYEKRDDSKLMDLFTLFTLNDDGTISVKELKYVISQAAGERISDREINEIFLEAESNRYGFIELHEFINVMKRHRDGVS